MEGFIIVVVLSATLWGLYLGIKFSLRAFRDPKNRSNNILSAAAGFLLAGFLSYPAFLGPIVARVACSSSVGFTMTARSDLRSNGYLVDWPANVASPMLQARGSALAGSPFETSRRDGSLQQSSLAPDD
jgi:hypothetical protein